jgi:inhibitor of cysteine peptidase
VPLGTPLPARVPQQIRGVADILVTEADRGSAASAKVGDALVVQLAETPTTGFRWAFAPIDTNILELTRDEFQAGAQVGVGGGGLRVFRFAVKGRGSTRVEFKVTRSWESGPPKALFEVRVNVS